MGKESMQETNQIQTEQHRQSDITRKVRYQDYQAGVNGYSLDQMINYQRMLEKDPRRS